MFTRRLALATRVAAALTFGAGAATALAAPATATTGTWSEKTPPPLCSQSQTGDCVQQPVQDYAGIAAQPVQVSMPVLDKVSSTKAGEVTWQATFTITSFADPNPGWSMRDTSWADSLELIPIPGLSDNTATAFSMVPPDKCSGIACTYATTASGLQAGWYYAGYAGIGLVGQWTCQSPNDAPCFETLSQSAVYVPGSSDLLPPRVAVAANGRGLTSKAVAAVRDPYNKSVSLLWDFGDGTRQTGTPGSVVTHQYTSPGNYTITALVSTADGRTNAATTSAGITPPTPVLQAVSRIGTTTQGVAAGLVQGWPSGARAYLRYWDTGCPPDPSDPSYIPDGFSSYVPVNADGTINLSFPLDQNASGFVVEVTDYLQLDNGRTATLDVTSACLSTVGTASTTTADASAGDTQIPISGPGVTDGHVAVIDAGTNAAEQRVVSAAGLQLAAPLSAGHPSGAYVIDAGKPIPTYVVPPAPADPTVPVLPGSSQTTSPGQPAITKVRVIGPRTAVLTIRAGSTGGSKITNFTAQCTSPNGGATRKASSATTPLTVRNLSPKKSYVCMAWATNQVGTSPASAPTKPFIA